MLGKSAELKVMAYTKIIPIRDRLDKAVNYALNEEKTHLDTAIEYISNNDKNAADDTIYETAINCMLDTAYKDMIHTKKAYNKTDGILGYHIIQSFSPNETTADIAHNVGVEFAYRCFGDKYEVVVSTHLDQHHIHNHVVMNSVSFMDGSKFDNSYKDYYQTIRKTSDEVCREYNLSIITPIKDNKSLSYLEWLEINKGKTTWNSLTRSDIDYAISTSYSFGEFVMDMEHMGYEIKQGKYLAVRPYGKERYSRSYKLGQNYSEDNIRARISGTKTKYVPPMKMVEYRKKITTMFPFTPNFIKEYWRLMYSLNLVKKRKAPPKVSKYLKKDLIAIERHKEQFRFLRAHNIESENEFNDFVKKVNSSISNQYSKLRSFDNAHKKNRKLYTALTDIEKYKKPYELYKEGYTMMQIEYDAYIKAKKILKDNGIISPENIEILKAKKVKMYKQRDEIMKDIKFHKNEKRICNNIQKTQDYIAERARLIEQQHAVSRKGREQDKRLR